jgi:hypothetical protein
VDNILILLKFKIHLTKKMQISFLLRKIAQFLVIIFTQIIFKKMKKISFLIVLALALGACAPGQFQKTMDDLLGGGQLTTEEIANGLKEALTQGVTRGAESASKTDGYFRNQLIRIPFPPEISQVETRLRQIGLGSEVDRFVMTLNRGAEEAAKEARPIFVNAIRSMTIQDAKGILQGENDAATRYLIRTTSSQLNASFKPVIQRALQQVEATKYYSDLINTYNRIPGVTKVNPNLDDYATTKAVDGLFFLIAQEEANIRQNPGARTTELLKKVFGQQK